MFCFQICNFFVNFLLGNATKLRSVLSNCFAKFCTVSFIKRRPTTFINQNCCSTFWDAEILVKIIFKSVLKMLTHCLSRFKLRSDALWYFVVTSNINHVSSCWNIQCVQIEVNFWLNVFPKITTAVYSRMLIRICSLLVSPWYFLFFTAFIILLLFVMQSFSFVWLENFAVLDTKVLRFVKTKLFESFVLFYWLRS